MDNKQDKPEEPEEPDKKVRFKYLKKGEGSLASSYHPNTKFSQKRREKIIMEQVEREIHSKTTL